MKPNTTLFRFDELRDRLKVKDEDEDKYVYDNSTTQVHLNVHLKHLSGHRKILNLIEMEYLLKKVNDSMETIYIIPNQGSPMYTYIGPTE